MEKLVRFDWAVKYLLRDKANFDILEGLLGALLHDDDIRIVDLLESESNRETDSDKLNRVDLLVKDHQGQLLIIEVQVETEHHYFHRIAYGTAKLLTQYLEKGQQYDALKKVISISITYFNLGTGRDYLYHGTTRFTGVHHGDELALTEKQQELFGLDGVHQIFPEYYLIRTGKFEDEILEALDEWVYMLKHSEVRPEFNAKNIRQASEKLEVMKLSPQKRQAYERFMDDLSYHKSMLWSARMDGVLDGRAEGLAEGKAEGRLEALQETAKNLLAEGMPVETVMKCTGLSREAVAQLQEEEVLK